MNNYTYEDIENILSDIETSCVLLRSNIFDNVNWCQDNSPKGKNNEYSQLDWYNFEFLYKISHKLTASNIKFFETEKDMSFKKSSIIANKDEVSKLNKDKEIKEKVLKARVRLLNEMIRAIDRNKTAASRHLQYCLLSEQIEESEPKIVNTQKNYYQKYIKISALYPETKNDILEIFKTKIY